MSILSQALLVLVVCLGAVRGLYFHISETEQKCFIEEVPSETMIVGKFHLMPTRDSMRECPHVDDCEWQYFP